MDGSVGRWIAGGLLIAALAGCSSSTPLAQRDPSGYEACQSLVVARQGNSTTKDGLAAKLAMGRQAHESTTAGIRGAVTGPTLGVYTADQDRLAAACEAEGVDVP